jgi:hypothetical protein
MSASHYFVSRNNLPLFVGSIVGRDTVQRRELSSHLGETGPCSLVACPSPDTFFPYIGWHHSTQDGTRNSRLCKVCAFNAIIQVRSQSPYARITCQIRWLALFAGTLPWQSSLPNGVITSQQCKSKKKQLTFRIVTNTTATITE